jgi:hypothetical protein
MPIDPNIALGVKQPQFESPLNTMANLYQMQGAQQANQLNQMKMDEYTRGVAEQEQFRNALVGSQDEAGIKNAFYAKGDVKGYNDYLKSKQETSNLGLTGEDLKGKILKAKTEHGQAMLRDLSRNPSDANVTAHFEDIQQSPLYTAQEKTASQGRLQEVLAMTVPERQAYLASQGASAENLKPAIQMQNLGGTSNVLSIPAFGGAPTTLSSSPISQSPDSVASGKIQTRGQDLTNARERERIANERNPAIVAHQQVSEDGTVTNFNKFGEVIGTVKGAGKPSAQFTKSKEQTKKLTSDLNLTITELENATKEGGLIDQSTGSGLGKATNVGRGFVTGGASKGAIAGAKLAPIADLALKMVPRFEGPQSDKDTQSYKEAAGQLADTSIPNEIRKEAGKTVLRLMKARKNQFVTQDMAQEGVVPNAGNGVDATNPLLK